MKILGKSKIILLPGLEKEKMRKILCEAKG